MDDGELAAFHDGDAPCFARLVAELSPRLLGAAWSLARDRAAAHDLVHDTWVRAFEARRTFDGRGSLLGWLLAVQRSVHLDRARADGRHARRVERATVEAAHDRAAGDAPLDLLVRGEAHARALRAVAGLPPRQRDVLVARVLEERSVRDTARLLGVADGTVKSTLAQALAHLRRLLGASTP